MAEAEAAVAIVHARLPEGSILLMRRAEREGDPWSGHWSFPGGRRDPGDPDLLHTAIRELREECGIELSREHVEVALPTMVARRKTGRYLLVAPFVFRVENELPAIPDQYEAVEAVWLPLSTVVDPARHFLTCVPGQPLELIYPGIHLNGLPLWGFTYRLITQWLRLGPEEHAVEQAGLEAASLVLEFLLSLGLALEHGWEDRTAACKVAAVTGVIPAAEVVAHFSAPGAHVAAVNCLEVRSDQVRVVGLAFEEYLIEAKRRS